MLAFNAVGIVKVMLIGLSLTTAFTLVFLCTMFCPSLCRKNTAFWTTLVGIVGLVAWQLFPEVRVLPHVIYFEWLICIITLLVVRVVDKTPITLPTVKAEYAEETKPVQRVLLRARSKRRTNCIRLVQAVRPAGLAAFCIDRRRGES